MTEREQGLYYPGGEFKTDDEIKRELAIEGNITEPVYETQIQVPLDVKHYIRSAKERAESAKELSPRSENYVEVALPETSIISVIGDIHFGSPNTDYDRLQQELEIITNSPHSYVILLGDLVEGIHWGGADEQSHTLDEQRGFLRGLFESLEGRALIGMSGEHDSKWAARTGADPYFDFSERTGAPYVRGVAEIKIGVGEQDYRVVAQHRARGHSMYNKNHPTFREARFELQGADIYISGHTHRKQVSQEGIREFNDARGITHISIGPYKTGDEYSDRQGFPESGSKEMFGASFKVSKDRHLVDVDYSIVEAHRKWV